MGDSELKGAVERLGDDKQRRRGSSRRALTRVDLGTAVYRECPRLSRRAARRICDEVLDEIVTALVEENLVRLQYFGSFRVREKRARVGRNPMNGVECDVDARRSPVLIASMNGSKVSERGSK